MIGDIRGRWGTILEIKAGVLAIVVSVGFWESGLVVGVAISGNGSGSGRVVLPGPVFGSTRTRNGLKIST